MLYYQKYLFYTSSYTSYLYDNWSKNSVFLHKNTPEDAEYDKVLNECFLSNKHRS